MGGNASEMEGTLEGGRGEKGIVGGNMGTDH